MRNFLSLASAAAKSLALAALSFNLVVLLRFNMALFFALFAWAGSAVVALLFLVAFGVANGFIEVVMMTAIHQEADAGYQGRVFGVGSTLWRTTMLGAVAFAPLVNAIASPAATITVAAAVLFAGAVLVQVTLRQSRRLATVPA